MQVLGSSPCAIRQLAVESARLKSPSLPRLGILFLNKVLTGLPWGSMRCIINMFDGTLQIQITHINPRCRGISSAELALPAEIKHPFSFSQNGLRPHLPTSLAEGAIIGLVQRADQ